MMVPQKNYEDSLLVKNAGKEITDKIEDFRYKKGEINSLPNGKLKETGEWAASEETALSVTDGASGFSVSERIYRQCLRRKISGKLLGRRPLTTR